MDNIYFRLILAGRAVDRMQHPVNVNLSDGVDDRTISVRTCSKLSK